MHTLATRLVWFVLLLLLCTFFSQLFTSLDSDTFHHCQWLYANKCFVQNQIGFWAVVVVVAFWLLFVDQLSFSRKFLEYLFYTNNMHIDVCFYLNFELCMAVLSCHQQWLCINVPSTQTSAQLSVSHDVMLVVIHLNFGNNL